MRSRLGVAGILMVGLVLRRAMTTFFAGAMTTGLMVSPASAFKITDNLELVTVASVGTTFQSVSFLNSYTTPVPVCVGQNLSTSNWTPLVRLRNVASGGMDVRVQSLNNVPTVAEPNNTPPVYVGTVYCLIAEAGSHPFPGATDQSKIWIEAGKHSVTNTYGSRVAAQRWNNADFDDDQVSFTAAQTAGLTGAYATAPQNATLNQQWGVLAQVMTYNDPLGQAPHVNDCESRANNPFQGGFSDGVCIGRHIGRLTDQNGAPTSRGGEDIGYLIFRTGSGQFVSNGVSYEFSGGLSADNVRSVRDNPPFRSASTNGVTLQGAVATQQAEDGGDGSYAALYGTDPLNGGTIDLTLDESVNADRNHTTEFVAFLGFRNLEIPIDVQKSVDLGFTDGFPTLNYTMTLQNTGTVFIDAADINVSDTIVQGTDTLTLLSPGLVADAGNNAAGLAANDTWTFTARYRIRENHYVDYGAGTIVNTFSATATVAGITETKTADAETVVSIDPDINVIKTAALDGGLAIPATGVQVGDVIEYTYEVHNRGNVAMTDVTLSDDHLGQGDANLTFGSCTISEDNVTSGNTTVGTTDFAIEVLAPRDRVECTATYTVTQDNIETLQNP